MKYYQWLCFQKDCLFRTQAHDFAFKNTVYCVPTRRKYVFQRRQNVLQNTAKKLSERVKLEDYKMMPVEGTILEGQKGCKNAPNTAKQV